MERIVRGEHQDRCVGVLDEKLADRVRARGALDRRVGAVARDDEHMYAARGNRRREFTVCGEGLVDERPRRQHNDADAAVACLRFERPQPHERLPRAGRHHDRRPPRGRVRHRRSSAFRVVAAIAFVAVKVAPHRGEGARLVRPRRRRYARAPRRLIARRACAALVTVGSLNRDSQRRRSDERDGPSRCERRCAHRRRRFDLERSACGKHDGEQGDESHRRIHNISGASRRHTMVSKATRASRVSSS